MKNPKMLQNLLLNLKKIFTYKQPAPILRILVNLKNKVLRSFRKQKELQKALKHYADEIIQTYEQRSLLNKNEEVYDHLIDMLTFLTETQKVITQNKKKIKQILLKLNDEPRNNHPTSQSNQRNSSPSRK